MKDVVITKGSASLRIDNMENKDVIALHTILSKHDIFVGSKPAKGYCQICGQYSGSSKYCEDCGD